MSDVVVVVIISLGARLCATLTARARLRVIRTIALMVSIIVILMFRTSDLNVRIRDWYCHPHIVPCRSCLAHTPRTASLSFNLFNNKTAGRISVAWPGRGESTKESQFQILLMTRPCKLTGRRYDLRLAFQLQFGEQKFLPSRASNAPLLVFSLVRAQRVV